MYVGAGKHEAAWRVASECLREAERSLLYLQKAGEAERAGEWMGGGDSGGDERG